jgi:hypothetical protein
MRTAIREIVPRFHNLGDRATPERSARKAVNPNFKDGARVKRAKMDEVRRSYQYYHEQLLLINFSYATFNSEPTLKSYNACHNPNSKFNFNRNNRNGNVIVIHTLNYIFPQSIGDNPQNGDADMDVINIDDDSDSEIRDDPRLKSMRSKLTERQKKALRALDSNAGEEKGNARGRARSKSKDAGGSGTNSGKSSGKSTASNSTSNSASKPSKKSGNSIRAKSPARGKNLARKKTVTFNNAVLCAVDSTPSPAKDNGKGSNHNNNQGRTPCSSTGEDRLNELLAATPRAPVEYKLNPVYLDWAVERVEEREMLEEILYGLDGWRPEKTTDTTALHAQLNDTLVRFKRQGFCTILVVDHLESLATGNVKLLYTLFDLMFQDDKHLIIVGTTPNLSIFKSVEGAKRVFSRCELKVFFVHTHTESEAITDIVKANMEYPEEEHTPLPAPSRISPEEHKEGEETVTFNFNYSW